MTKRERFEEYIEETVLNKLVAVSLLVSGIIGAVVSKEGNLLVMALLIGLPLFFEKENVFK